MLSCPFVSHSPQRYSNPPEELASEKLSLSPPIEVHNDKIFDLRTARCVIEDWSYRQVERLIRSYDKSELDHHGRPPGFALFGELILDRRYRRHPDGGRLHYPNLDTLSEWEKQPYGDCAPEEFDHCLVAKVGPAITGVLYCQWCRTENYWYYLLRYIDVHSGWQNQGIAKLLLTELNQSYWLKNKALYLTPTTEMGQRYLANSLQRLLIPSDYTILGDSYYEITLPEQPGRWG